MSDIFDQMKNFLNGEPEENVPEATPPGGAMPEGTDTWDGEGVDTPAVPLIKEADPELEKLLAEETAIEEQYAADPGPFDTPAHAEMPKPTGFIPATGASGYIDPTGFPALDDEGNVVQIPFEAVGPPQEEEPQEEVPNYPCWLNYDSESSDLRYAVLQDDGSFILNLPEGTEVTEISSAELHKHVQAGETRFALDNKIVKVDFQAGLQRCCKWLSPSKEQAKLGAVNSEAYDFDRPFSYTSCSHPQLVKESGSAAAPACTPGNNGMPLTTCSFFEPDAKVTTRAFHAEGVNRTIKEITVRRNFGLVQHVISLVNEETPEADPVELAKTTVNAATGVTPEQADGLFDTVLRERMTELGITTDEGLQTLEDVTYKFAPIEKPKDSYLQHVVNN